MATQDIQFIINFSTGIHFNTIYKNGKLQLQELGMDSLGQIVYADSGYWISDSIQFADKFKEYKPFQLTLEQDNGTSYKISVSSSDNKIVWSDFQGINESKTIVNTPSSYIKIRIELFASKNHSEYIVDSFTGNEYGNKYIEVSNSQLKLKRDHILEFVNDNDSNYHLKKFSFDKNKYKSIKRLRGE